MEVKFEFRTFIPKEKNNIKEVVVERIYLFSLQPNSSHSYSNFAFHNVSIILSHSKSFWLDKGIVS